MTGIDIIRKCCGTFCEPKDNSITTLDNAYSVCLSGIGSAYRFVVCAAILAANGRMVFRIDAIPLSAAVANNYNSSFYLD